MGPAVGCSGDFDAVVAFDVKDEIVAGIIYSAMDGDREEGRGCGARYIFVCC